MPIVTPPASGVGLYEGFAGSAPDGAVNACDGAAGPPTPPGVDGDVDNDVDSASAMGAPTMSMATANGTAAGRP